MLRFTVNFINHDVLTYTNVSNILNSQILHIIQKGVEQCKYLVMCIYEVDYTIIMWIDPDVGSSLKH